MKIQVSITRSTKLFTRKKSVKHVEHIDPASIFMAKPTVSQIAPDHAIHNPGTYHVVTRSKPKIIRQDKPVHDDQNYRSPHKSIK